MWAEWAVKISSIKAASLFCCLLKKKKKKRRRKQKRNNKKLYYFLILAWIIARAIHKLTMDWFDLSASFSDYLIINTFLLNQQKPQLKLKIMFLFLS